MTREYLLSKRTLAAFLTGGALFSGECDTGAVAALDGTAWLLQVIASFL